MRRLILGRRDRDCPLVFSAFIGDHRTTALLMSSSDWADGRSARRARAFAATLGHAMCLTHLLVRPCPLEGLAELSILQGNSVCAGLVLDKARQWGQDLGPEVNQALVWAVHMDRPHVLSECAQFGGLELETLMVVALMSNASLSFETLLGLLRGPLPLKTARVLARTRPEIFAAVEARKGTLADAGVLAVLQSQGRLFYRAVLRARARRFWRKLRVVARVVLPFWRAWQDEYYAPGGAGYARAMQGWLDEVRADREDEAEPAGGRERDRAREREVPPLGG